MSPHAAYRGRFAPSPTGPLHFGSLIAAMGSYLEAKQQQGMWLVRIDDIDPPREQKGAATDILKTLEAFGFEWDAEVLYQSSRLNRYQEAVNDLLRQNKAYPCKCSRKSIIEATGKSQGEIVYPGYCRHGLKDTHTPPLGHAVRLLFNSQLLSFNDAVQGQQSVNPEKEIGDFIIQRRDQYFSYQLATGIDDAEQNISHVVRGADLLNCTPCQLHVQKELDLPSPEYCHLPIALNHENQKLSKQSHADAILEESATSLLLNALKFLGQMPPIELMDCNKDEIWKWAKSHWQLELVPKQSKLKIDWYSD